MIQPPNSLAIQLQDSCSSCGQSCQPIVVDGTSDTPTAGYHDTNGHVWFVEWQRSYTKKVAEAIPTIPPPVPVGAQVSTSANPNTSLEYSTPVCKACSLPLGQGHSPTCPFNSGG